jgi:D-arabinose 5-phosphate isomerase GutQ
MGKFVQLVTFESSSGRFDERKDTETINGWMRYLQNEGAEIISVTPALGGQMAKSSAVYVILYEAEEPIEFE